MVGNEATSNDHYQSDDKGRTQPQVRFEDVRPDNPFF